MDTVRYLCPGCGSRWDAGLLVVDERLTPDAVKLGECGFCPGCGHCIRFSDREIREAGGSKRCPGCPTLDEALGCMDCSQPGAVIPVAKPSAAVYASAALNADAKGKKDFDGSIDGAGYKASFDDPAKPPVTLVTRTFIWCVARVLGIGAQKYARGNWMRGMSFAGCADGVMRHITAWLSGETYDPETGQNHLAHAACGLMFLLTFQEGPRKDEYARFDDRISEVAG